MTNQDSSKQQKTESEEGFPIQFKLLLVVIALGLLAVVLKGIGIL